MGWAEGALLPQGLEGQETADLDVVFFGPIFLQTDFPGN